MKKIYDKNELNFALIWIGIYVVLLSVGDSISKTIGTAKIVTAPLCIVLTSILYLWLRKNNLKKKYGLCLFEGNAKKYLYFLPLILVPTTNIWWGLRWNMTIAESVLCVISMLCIGFLEELVFRGFLFKALCKANVKRAIIISGITFGFGHIVNLLNGRDIPGTLLQMCYAVALGYLFTIIFYKTKTLWPCILTHSACNCLSVFNNMEGAPSWYGIAASIFLCVVSLSYALYILHKTKGEKTISV